MWKLFVFGVILVHILPHSDWIREHVDQNNFEYGHFLRSDKKESLSSNLGNVHGESKYLTLQKSKASLEKFKRTVFQ